MSSTTFNSSYFLSLIITLTSIYILHIKYNERMPKIIIYFVIPICISYISLFIFNNLTNHVNDTSDNIIDYLEDKYITTLEKTKYYSVFPVFLLFFIILSILIYLGLFN